MDDKHATKQPYEQDELDEQPIPDKNNSPDDLTPDTSPEHKNLHKRLVATARSLRKQKRKLKTAEDALRMRAKYSIPQINMAIVTRQRATEAQVVARI